jgi:hypothetical protein
MKKDDTTIEKFVEISHQEFLNINNSMATKENVTLILRAIEHHSGQMADVKQHKPSALDFARLEGRVNVIEKKLGLKG